MPTIFSFGSKSEQDLRDWKAICKTASMFHDILWLLAATYHSKLNIALESRTKKIVNFFFKLLIL